MPKGEAHAGGQNGSRVAVSETQSRPRPSVASPVTTGEGGEREGLRGREVRHGPWSPVTTSPTSAAGVCPGVPCVAATWSMLDADAESQALPKTNCEGPVGPSESPA